MAKPDIEEIERRRRVAEFEAGKLAFIRGCDWHVPEIYMAQSARDAELYRFKDGKTIKLKAADLTDEEFKEVLWCVQKRHDRENYRLRFWLCALGFILFCIFLIWRG